MKNIIDPLSGAMNPFDELDQFYDTAAKRMPNDVENVAARKRISERTMDWLMKDPVLIKYIDHIKGSNSINTLPEHALGERLYAVLTAALAARGDVPILGPYAPEAEADDNLKNVALGAALMLLKAQVYLWSDKMERVADASPLPTHIVSRNVLPYPLMFWSRETRYTFKDHEGKIAANNWICLMHHTDCFYIIGDQSYHDQQLSKLTISFMKYAGRWPNDYDTMPELSLILKRCAFLSSPFVVTDRRRMTHVARRQLERDHGLSRDDCNKHEAHVVQLRRLSFHRPQPTGDHRDTEWKHHWWVSQHYRAQWYPSEQAHRVIYIAPHIKGDLKKPLLEKVYAVVR